MPVCSLSKALERSRHPNCTYLDSSKSKLTDNWPVCILATGLMKSHLPVDLQVYFLEPAQLPSQGEKGGDWSEIVQKKAV